MPIPQDIIFHKILYSTRYYISQDISQNILMRIYCICHKLAKHKFEITNWLQGFILENMIEEC